MKTYILQKDLPDCKAGAEFIMGVQEDAYYLTSDRTETKMNCYMYPVKFVENNPEWFIQKENHHFELRSIIILEEDVDQFIQTMRTLDSIIKRYGPK